MRSMEDITKMFQRVAMETNESSVPTNITIGTVESIAPLQVRLDQKLILNDSQLLLTKNVLDYEVEMTVDHVTESVLPNNPDLVDAHNHEYKGRKKFLVHNALQVGDDVVMIKNKGGQLYVIIDKVVKA